MKDNKFIEHLEKVSKIVRSWPKWKQNIWRVYKEKVENGQSHYKYLGCDKYSRR